MQNLYKRVAVFSFFFLGIILVTLSGATNILAGDKKITILYGNDIRGEVEPCG